MQQATIQRLLPQGATTSSAHLCVMVVALTPFTQCRTVNPFRYETSDRPPNAAVGTLHAGRDATVAYSQDASAQTDSEHPAEMSCDSPAEPLPALSRTYPPALWPAHPGDLRLPLRTAQPPRWRCQHLPAPARRGRRHHRPP